MNMIYNSANYCVVEFSGYEEPNTGAGGFEIMDKFSKKEIFLDGALAEHFRQSVQKLAENEPSMEEVDDFLDQFGSLMQQPVILH